MRTTKTRCRQVMIRGQFHVDFINWMLLFNQHLRSDDRIHTYIQNKRTRTKVEIPSPKGGWLKKKKHTISLKPANFISVICWFWLSLLNKMQMESKSKSTETGPRVQFIETHNYCFPMKFTFRGAVTFFMLRHYATHFKSFKLYFSNSTPVIKRNTATARPAKPRAPTLSKLHKVWPLLIG